MPTESAEAAVRYVVLGSVLVEPLLLALRRVAEQVASARRFGRGAAPADRTRSACAMIDPMYMAIPPLARAIVRRRAAGRDVRRGDHRAGRARAPGCCSTCCAASASRDGSHHRVMAGSSCSATRATASSPTEDEASSRWAPLLAERGAGAVLAVRVRRDRQLGIVAWRAGEEVGRYCSDPSREPGADKEVLDQPIGAELAQSLAELWGSSGCCRRAD